MALLIQIELSVTSLTLNGALIPLTPPPIFPATCSLKSSQKNRSSFTFYLQRDTDVTTTKINYRQLKQNEDKFVFPEGAAAAT